MIYFFSNLISTMNTKAIFNFIPASFIRCIPIPSIKRIREIREMVSSMFLEEDVEWVAYANNRPGNYFIAHTCNTPEKLLRLYNVLQVYNDNSPPPVCEITIFPLDSEYCDIIFNQLSTYLSASEADTVPHVILQQTPIPTNKMLRHVEGNKPPRMKRVGVIAPTPIRTSVSLV